MTISKFSVARANSFISENKKLVNPKFKPNKHFSAEIGWINDPNGFVFFQGSYHLFYQFNPYESVWGPMHWGHAKSNDLVHWEHLPIALAPDQDYDRNGCFSGSALVKDDKLWLMYTGHIEEADGSIRQVQNMAYSEDGIHFKKIAQNPIVTGEDLPEELIAADFRDPKLFEKDGCYYAVVAAKHRDEVGTIVLLGSKDLLNWKFESIFLKGEAHQGFMWECPDYFNLDGKDCLIVSPMGYERSGDSYHNINSSVLMTGIVDWESMHFIPKSIEEIDHGQDFYAPQTLLDPAGHRVMIAWMQTWGRTIPSHDQGHKWANSMTLPRQLHLEQCKLSQTLLPITEAQLDENNCFEVEIDSDKHFCLGEKQDYIAFGYDSQRQEVYIDRSHLALPIVGEEAQDTSRRYVYIKAERLKVVLDTNSIELFVNGGQQVLTATFFLKASHTLSEVKG